MQVLKDELVHAADKVVVVALVRHAQPVPRPRVLVLPTAVTPRTRTRASRAALVTNGTNGTNGTIRAAAAGGGSGGCTASHAGRTSVTA